METLETLDYKRGPFCPQYFEFLINTFVRKFFKILSFPDRNFLGVSSNPRV